MKPFSYVWFDSFFFWTGFFFGFVFYPCFGTRTHKQFSILKSVLLKIRTGKGKLTSLITILLLVKFINYDIVT